MSPPRSYANSRTGTRVLSVHGRLRTEHQAPPLGKISSAGTEYSIAYTVLRARIVMPITLSSSSYPPNYGQQS